MKHNCTNPINHSINYTRTQIFLIIEVNQNIIVRTIAWLQRISQSQKFIFQICSAFMNYESFGELSIPIIIIEFNSQVDKDALHSTTNGYILQIWYDVIKEILSLRLKNKDNHSIKIVDIPINYPTESIIDKFNSFAQWYLRIYRIYQTEF